jgi:hypothetical protein
LDKLRAGQGSVLSDVWLHGKMLYILLIDSSYVEYSVNCIIGGYLRGCDYKHVIFREGFD